MLVLWLMDYVELLPNKGSIWIVFSNMNRAIEPYLKVYWISVGLLISTHLQKSTIV